MTSELSIAMHALVFLHRANQVVSSERLAQSVCTNPARIRKVMARLKAASLVGAKEGSVGGYYMRKTPEEITLSMLLDALDTRLITSSMRADDANMPCVIASGMKDLVGDLCDMLNDRCREELSRITIMHIDARIPAGNPYCADV